LLFLPPALERIRISGRRGVFTKLEYLILNHLLLPLVKGDALCRGAWVSFWHESQLRLSEIGGSRRAFPEDSAGTGINNFRQHVVNPHLA
jgi:hypothetical protein